MTQQQMVSLTSDSPHRAPEAGSPVRIVTGRVIGYTASSDFGYTVGKTITYAWLDPDFTEPGTDGVITHLNRSVPATVAVDTIYDPQGDKNRRQLSRPHILF